MLSKGKRVRNGRRDQPKGLPPDRSTAVSAQAPLPVWAMQRVATALASESGNLALRPDALDLARRTGLSKSLARRCLRQLEKQKIAAQR
jgi:hypothetical protein